MTNPGAGILHRYREHFDFINSESRLISLNEGNTPLLAMPNLAKAICGSDKPDIEVYVKFEGLNPTGSFKDRGMSAAVTQAVGEGAKTLLCASTGNTSASASAYAARAGIKALVLIPEGKIAAGKLAQAIVYGGEIIQIKGNFDDAMELVKEAAQKLPLVLVNSVNPYRLQGQKTAAFEIVDELGGDAPDYHCLPVGNAGNISAYWMGYKEYKDKGKAKKTPIMCGYQASGAAPFLKGEPVSNPETIATAIRIGNPQSWELAENAVKESSGHFVAHPDSEIVNAQQLLASSEGVFCEPASAISIAGLMADYKAGFIAKGSRVACTLTGNGLKDIDTALQHIDTKPKVIEPSMAALEKVVG